MSNKYGTPKPRFLEETRPILYTTIPPKDVNDIPARKEALTSVFADKRIHAISAPELITRKYSENNVQYTLNTVPPEIFLETFSNDLERITTLIIPMITKEKYLSRLNDIKSKGIHSAILVGPEHSMDVNLLGGYPLEEGIEIAANNGFVVGGITIPWRKTYSTFNSNSKPLVEYERLLYKQKYGCSFVTSQLVFEAASPIRLMSEYAAHCKDDNIEPMTLFFSFCVVPSKKTLDFLYELDVDIPALKRRRLLNSANLEKESLEIAHEIWSGIRDAQKSHAPNIKVGMQIEQIQSNRVVNSLALLDSLMSVE